MKSGFNKDQLTFEFTFQNEYDYPIYIIRVGAIGMINYGDFNCPPTKWVPDPVSDYLVSLPAYSDTVFQSASPVKVIYPKNTETITVGVIPSIRTACDAWAIDVSALVKFHFGYTFQSSAELIMSQDIDALTLNPYTDQELTSMLINPDPAQKVVAINKLQFSGIDRTIIVNHLSNRLKDDVVEVRMAAANAIKDMQIESLYDQLSSNLLSAPSLGERIAIIRILGKISDSRIVDPLINRILNGDTIEAEIASKALVDIKMMEVSNKIRFVLQRHETWANGTAEEQNRLLCLSRILIRYKDMAGIPLLKKFLVIESSSARIKHSILMDLASLIERYQLVKDNYLLNFRDLYSNFLNHQDDFVRFNALNLYAASDADSKAKSKVIRRALKDPEYHIQCRAAVWAGELGFNEFAGDIKVMCQAAEGPEYTEICEALIKLNASGRD